MAKRTTRKARAAKSTTRAAIYARFSCDKQRDASIEDQVEACNSHCAKYGYTMVSVYSDYAISGRSDDRPQFLQMVEDAGKGLFDVILVWKMDRFARNMQDQYYYEKVLAGYDVRFESVMENIAGNGIEATMSKGMYAMFAQIRSEQTAIDTMRGMLGKAKKCQWLGDVLYGYKREGEYIVVDEIEAEVVIKVHNDYLWGKPISDIVLWLDSQGVKTPRGADPSCNWVNAMLRNEKYAGIYKWGYEKDSLGNPVLDANGEKIPLVYIEDGLPAIVSREQKESCIRKLDYRRRLKANGEYYLSGKLYCSECGQPMHGETCRSRNGTVYRHYNCHKKRKACTGSYIVERLDYAVACGVRQLLEDEELVEQLADRYMQWYEKTKDTGPTVEAYERELRDIARKRDNLLQAIAEGMPYASAREKLESLDAMEQSTLMKLEAIQKKRRIRTKGNIVRFFTMMANGSRTDKEILEAFIDEAWVYGDKAVAVMNFDTEKTTKYEIDLVMKHEPPGQEAVRVSSLWLPKPCTKRTSHTKGLAIIMLDNGIGVVVSLKAA